MSESNTVTVINDLKLSDKGVGKKYTARYYKGPNRKVVDEIDFLRAIDLPSFFGKDGIMALIDRGGKDLTVLINDDGSKDAIITLIALINKNGADDILIDIDLWC